MEEEKKTVADKEMIKEINKTLDDARGVVQEVLPNGMALLTSIYNLIYPVINQFKICNRRPFRDSILEYLDLLIERGVTPDEALRFIAKNEVKRLEGTDLGAAISKVIEVASRVLGTDQGMALFSQVLNGMMADGPDVGPIGASFDGVVEASGITMVPRVCGDIIGTKVCCYDCKRLGVFDGASTFVIFDDGDVDNPMRFILCEDCFKKRTEGGGDGEE